jgi:hypothetical protein
MPVIPPPSLSIPSGNLSGGLWCAWIVATITGIWRSSLGKIVSDRGNRDVLASVVRSFSHLNDTTTTISNIGTSGSNSLIATDVSAQIPTDVPQATAISAPTEQPTAVTVLPACDADRIVAASWPMLDEQSPKSIAHQQNRRQFGQSLWDEHRYHQAPQDDRYTNPSTRTIIGAMWQWRRSTSAPFGITAGMMLDCQLNNTCTQQTAVMRQAQLVIRNQTLFGEFNIDSSKSLLSQFSQRSVNKNVIKIAVFNNDNINDNIWESLISPLIHTPLVTTIKAKGVWGTDNELISTTVERAANEFVYDDVHGITALTQPTTLNQFSRTIDVSKISWKDGKTATALVANDYVHWFAQCSSINVSRCRLIDNVVAKTATKITITYIPGLPETLANLIAPRSALKERDQNILDSHSTDWHVVSRSANVLTLQNSSNTTLEIQQFDSINMQLLLG